MNKTERNRSSIGVGGTEPLYDLMEIFNWTPINGVTERSERAPPVTERSEEAHPATKRSEGAHPVTERIKGAHPATERSEGASPNNWSEMQWTPINGWSPSGIWAEMQWTPINGVTERSKGAPPATERIKGAHPGTKQSERASPNNWSEMQWTPINGWSPSSNWAAPASYALEPYWWYHKRVCEIGWYLKGCPKLGPLSMVQSDVKLFE